MAMGLFIAGVCSFAFLRVGKSALGGEEAFQPVQIMWFATFGLAPGFFLPLEQELGRSLSVRRALGQGGRPIVSRVTTLGAIIAGAVSLAVLAAGPWLRNAFFNGSWVMVVALAFAIAAYAPAHIARGLCSGSGRFRGYAVVMAADGVIRIMLCLLLAAASVSAIGWFGLAVAVAPLPGVFYVASRGDLHTEPGPPAPWSEVTPNLGWLLLGSVMAAGLVNAGPLAAKLLLSSNDDALVTRFGTGVILARVPLFLFQAVQAALLPRLAHQAARGEMDDFMRGFRRLMQAVLVVGAAGVAGAFLVGPFAVKVLGSSLSRRTLAILAVGSVFYMLALAIAQAVIALHGHAWVAAGWVVGMAGFVVSTWLLGGEALRRVELGLIIGPGAAMLVFAYALRVRLRAGVQPDAESVYEALTDMPIEP